MVFLIPDKIITAKVGAETLTIKQKITPDGARATKDICSYIKKGDLVKPNAKLNNGAGIPKAITVHNSGPITVSSKTTQAEQYARATYPNGNIRGAAIHYWVWHSDIWQQLFDDERGWHAADGSSHRIDHRGNLTGGNLDTISIECIGSDPESEATTAKLVAYLCDKYNLDPAYDVYTHNYWMYGKDSFFSGVRKNCPAYILEHWSAFLANVKKHYDTIRNIQAAPAPGAVEKEKNKVEVLLNVVKKGSKGNDVKALQTLLNGYGYKVGNIDSVFGSLTQTAVKKYQHDNELDDDGVVGAVTWSKLLGV